MNALFRFPGREHGAYPPGVKLVMLVIHPAGAGKRSSPVSQTPGKGKVAVQTLEATAGERQVLSARENFPGFGATREG